MQTILDAKYFGDILGQQTISISFYRLVKAIEDISSHPI